MNQPRILTLVPALPPTVNGLGDYAFNLAKSMKELYDVDTVFLNSDVDSLNNKIVEFIVEPLNTLKSQTLINQLILLNPEFFIINYVGYAYSAYGAPVWLANAVEKWKEIRPESKVITIFHELYASGRPWKKAFWLMCFQKEVAFKLFKWSDFSITNTEITYSILKNKNLSKEIQFLPVISNINRIDKIINFSNRDNTLVIFGTLSVRNKLFKNHDLLSKWLKFLNIERIIEIGPIANREFTSINGIPLIQKGVLPEKEISSILNQSKYGMLSYPTHLLSKSGVFAAYASHGVIPIITGDRKRKESKLREEEHYLVMPINSINYDKMSNSVLDWYHKHNVAELSGNIYRMIHKDKDVIK